MEDDDVANRESCDWSRIRGTIEITRKIAAEPVFVMKSIPRLVLGLILLRIHEDYWSQKYTAI